MAGHITLNFFNFPFCCCSTLFKFDGSIELDSRIPNFESFHLNATSSSLLTRKLLSPQLKVSSLLNKKTLTSSFAFYCFLPFGAFLFFTFSISGSSFWFSRTTPTPQSEFLVNFVCSDGDIRNLSQNMQQELPFSFSVS